MFKKSGSKKVLSLDWTSLVNNLEETEREIEKSSNKYRLSKLMQKGACFRCMIGVCNIPNKKHAFSEYPAEISEYLKNPLKIKGLEPVIRRCCNWKEVGKQIFFGTCLNGLVGNCKNCSEGRYKTFIFNNNEYVCCYGVANPKNPKTNVSIHFDLEFKTNADGSGIEEVSVFPIIGKDECIGKDDSDIKELFPSLESIQTPGSTTSSIKTVPSQSPLTLSYANAAITKSFDSFSDFLSPKTPVVKNQFINEYAIMEREYHNTPLNKYKVFYDA